MQVLYQPHAGLYLAQGCGKLLQFLIKKRTRIEHGSLFLTEQAFRYFFSFLLNLTRKHWFYCPEQREDSFTLYKHRSTSLPWNMLKFKLQIWSQNWRTVKEDRHQKSIREHILVCLPFIMIVISKKRKENHERQVLWWRTKPSSLKCSHRSWVPFVLLEKTENKTKCTQSTLTSTSDFCYLIFWQIFLLSLDVLWKASETK